MSNIRLKFVCFFVLNISDLALPVHLLTVLRNYVQCLVIRYTKLNFAGLIISTVTASMEQDATSYTTQRKLTRLLPLGILFAKFNSVLDISVC